MWTVVRNLIVSLFVVSAAAAYARQDVVVSGVDFASAQKQYRQGEVIQFSFHNGTGDVLSLPTPAPWYITRGNQIVYKLNAPAELTPIAAGGVDSWSVSPGPSEFGDVSKPGKYEIHLPFYDAIFQRFEIVCSFQVAGS